MAYAVWMSEHVHVKIIERAQKPTWIWRAFGWKVSDFIVAKAACFWMLTAFNLLIQSLCLFLRLVSGRTVLCLTEMHSGGKLFSLSYQPANSQNYLLTYSNLHFPFYTTEKFLYHGIIRNRVQSLLSFQAWFDRQNLISVYSQLLYAVLLKLSISLWWTAFGKIDQQVYIMSTFFFIIRAIIGKKY